MSTRRRGTGSCTSVCNPGGVMVVVVRVVVVVVMVVDIVSVLR